MTIKRMPTTERIARNVTVDPSGCWLWQGHVGPNGYGRTQAWDETRGKWKTALAHRVSYEAHVGPIPEGMQLDHLCRVRACVNSDHLEPVTPLTNNARSGSPSAVNARKTHCPRDHELTLENTYVEPGGSRYCKTCRRAALRRWRDKHIGADAIEMAS